MISILAAAFVSVQVGSYSEEPRAVHVVEDLRAKGYDPYFLEYDSAESGAHVFKVRVGSYRDSAAAHAAAEKVKALGADYAGAFVTQTDLGETQTLSADILGLFGQLGLVNPGHIATDDNGRRLRAWVQDYVTLYLLAANDPAQTPGKRLTDLAAWDANEGNEPEIFAALDESRAYALFWRKDQSRFVLSELYRGAKVAFADALDLTPGPEKFICVSYEQGGDLYSERGWRVVRWDQPSKNFSEVGKIPLDVVDHGEEPGAGLTHKRVLRAVKNVDGDPDREILLDDTLVVGSSGTASKSHLDVWDWRHGRLERVDDSAWFEAIFADDPDSSLAAEGELGAGIEKGLSDDLAGAEQVFQLLVTKHPSTESAKRAASAIQQIGERRNKAKVLTQTGFDEVRAGAPELAEQDLRDAVVNDPGNDAAWYDLAIARTATGDPLGAVRALRKAFVAAGANSDALKQKAAADPDLASLREMPEFKELTL